MKPSPRFVGIGRFTFISFLAFLMCSWLLLYFDSVRQRRRAERMLLDVKTLPFGTAGFVEVRDFANRYGGKTIQQFPNLRFLPPGVPPPPDIQGHTITPLSYATGPICSVRDCNFEIRILPYVSKLALAFYLPDSPSGFVLAHVGLRPWIVAASFQVKDGKLWDSEVGAEQIRHSRSLSFNGLSELVYGIRIYSLPFGLDTHRTPGYSVGVPIITGGVGIGDERLTSWLLQPSNIQFHKAFDIDLHCLTFVSRNCGGLSEIAPSAWTYYQQVSAVQSKSQLSK
jgi:hypothetical protein